MNIFIVGVGMGDTKYLTKIAEEKINIKRKFGIFLYNIYPKLQS